VYIFVLFFIFGCALKENAPELLEEMSEKEEIKEQDYLLMPQDVTLYLAQLKQVEESFPIQKNHTEKYFSVWNYKRVPKNLESIQWPYRTYKAGETYGDNLKPLQQSFFDTMTQQSAFENYASLSRNAITIQYVNLRLFPSERAVLKDPSIAGEGFPFDYAQNSSVAPNKPLFVSHYSKDKEWAFVFSSFASGWIKTKEFVFLDPQYTQQIQEAEQIYIIKEGEALYDEENNFLFRSRVGMLLPLIHEDAKHYTVLAVGRYKEGKALFVRSKIEKEIGHKDILSFSKENLQNVIQEVSKTSYGWGGLFEQRDCSSMLRDIFTPFGIWLPRNSFEQSKVGEVISLEEFDDSTKLEYIKEHAIAFQTLLYKKGHIVLYVGTYNNEVVVFHNTWGIKTLKDGQDGRVIIGESIFSSLRLGKELTYYDEDAALLKSIKSMNILTR